MDSTKQIIITGGTGYVGSRVARSLAARGYRVVVVDNVRPEVRGVAFPKGVEFRCHDVRDTKEAVKAFVGGGALLHLAADIGSLTYMHKHQADIITNNAAIDVAIYSAARQNDVAWIIYSSSSMIYQHVSHYPYTEEDAKNIKPPSNVYGFSKLSGEFFCKAYRAQYGIPFTILRYHNIYGPGEDSKGSSPGDIHVIPALLEKVIVKKQYPLEILGDPSATRPFTYVDDAVEATVRMVMLAHDKSDVVRDTDFNVGTNRYHSILELGETIWKLFGDGRPFAYVTVKTPAITAVRREVDIAKIKKLIGWEPQVLLEDGLLATAEWIRER